MTLYDSIFYIFAFIVILSSIVVVTARNIVYSAFALLFTFFSVAGIYVLLSADFIAVVQVIIYVGGILVLIIFGVMLTNKITNVEIKTESIHVVPTTIAVGILGGVLVAAFTKKELLKSEQIQYEKTILEIGKKIITDYMLLFELAGIILLVALIGAVMMARKKKSLGGER